MSYRSTDKSKSTSKTFVKKFEPIAWGKRKVADWEVNGTPVGDKLKIEELRFHDMR